MPLDSADRELHQYSSQMYGPIDGSKFDTRS